MDKKSEIDHINERFDAIEQSFSKALEDLRAEALAGFPNRDPQGHRVYHEAEIERAEFYSKLRKEVLFHIVKAAGLAVTIFIGVALFNAVKGFLQ